MFLLFINYFYFKKVLFTFLDILNLFAPNFKLYNVFIATKIYKFPFFSNKNYSYKIIKGIYPSLKNEIMFQKWYVYDKYVAFHLKGNVMTNMLVVHNYMYMCEHSFFLPYISYPNFTRRFMNVHTLDEKMNYFELEFWHEPVYL